MRFRWLLPKPMPGYRPRIDKVDRRSEMKGVECKEVQFSRHAVERMFQRSLRPEHIRESLAKGEVIADYPDVKPFPVSAPAASY